ncbi:MAG: aminotransferase class I/II-fold pyridoxal phosphate-dependent enzyme [Bdellovibrionaceae bacterium]|nr:aminotransferase class I/II-fold pyridoxal phosphate-dependent enzyme [Pseudobdellovibrionaceae bacterium]
MDKKKLDELAIFSGIPSFEEKLHVGRPNVGDRKRFLQRVEDMFDRRWFTNNGPFVQEFEQKICDYLGVKHCIVVCNATIALEIAARALDLSGEVIVPSFTFVATAHALQWQKITPVFCDVNPQTHCLDIESVRRKITPRTTGIVGVHVWGQPCEIEALTNLVREQKLKLLFDAAHAMGSAHRGQMIGNFGDAEVFSFHATKFFNSFEGGAITTNNSELASKIRLMKNFGFSGLDKVVFPGTNGKMTEVSAAMGLTSLESIDSFIEINQRNFQFYNNELKNLNGIKVFQYEKNEKRNFQYIILEVDESQTGLTRDQLVQILHSENVLARKYFYPGVHEMEPYKTDFPQSGKELPETKSLCQRVMSLPNGSSVNIESIKHICEIIRIAVKHPVEIREKLASL